jgi:hypothetical protein
LWWSRIFPGALDQLGGMRRRAEDLLPESGGGAVLVASELAANAVLHTRSGDDGCFSVEVCRAGSWARIAVGDGNGRFAAD